MTKTYYCLALLIITGLLGGCASTPDNSALYLLDQHVDTTKTHADSAVNKRHSVLTLSQIKLASYLTHDGIVYQTGPNRIVVARSNRWAAPLHDQLVDGLYEALDAGLNAATVRRPGVIPSSAADFRLVVHINQLQGRYDGTAIISGNWRLFASNSQRVASDNFVQTTSLRTDGYAALVRALSRNWTIIKQAIVQGIGQALPHSPAKQN